MATASDLRYQPKELAYRTQYAELKERVDAAGPLLPGTPNTLGQRSGTGYPYCYRVYYPVPGMPSKEPPTSVKLRRSDGLRVDLLTDRLFR